MLFCNKVLVIQLQIFRDKSSLDRIGVNSGLTIVVSRKVAHGLMMVDGSRTQFTQYCASGDNSISSFFKKRSKFSLGAAGDE